MNKGKNSTKKHKVKTWLKKATDGFICGKNTNNSSANRNNDKHPIPQLKLTPKSGSDGDDHKQNTKNQYICYSDTPRSFKDIYTTSIYGNNEIDSKNDKYQDGKSSNQYEQEINVKLMIDVSKLMIELKTQKDFNNKYMKLNLISKGANGKIYVVKSWYGSQLYAMKEIYFKHLKINVLYEILRNWRMAQKLRLIGAETEIFVDSTKSIFLIVMHLYKGSLCTLLKQRWSNGTSGFTENELKQVLANGIIDSLQIIHSNGCIHGDIKPENLVYEYKNGCDNITTAIIDYDLCKQYDIKNQKDILSEWTGSLGYSAPEWQVCQGNIKSKITSKVDIFSLGLTMLFLLCGQHPFLCSRAVKRNFQSENPREDFKQTVYKILVNEGESMLAEFLKKLADNISDDLYNLLQLMLKMNPRERIDIYHVKNHKWFQETKMIDLSNEMDEKHDMLFDKPEAVATSLATYIEKSLQKNDTNNIKYENKMEDISDKKSKIIVHKFSDLNIPLKQKQINEHIKDHVRIRDHEKIIEQQKQHIASLQQSHQSMVFLVQQMNSNSTNGKPVDGRKQRKRKKKKSKASLNSLDHKDYSSYHTPKVPIKMSKELTLNIAPAIIYENIKDIFTYMKDSIKLQLNDHEIEICDGNKGDIIINFDFHNKINQQLLYGVAVKQKYKWEVTKFLTSKEIELLYNIKSIHLPQSSRSKFTNNIEHIHIFSSSLTGKLQMVASKCKWQHIPILSRKNNKQRMTLSCTKQEFIEKLKIAFSNRNYCEKIIPIIMFNNNINTHRIEYILIIRIQHNIDIGIAFILNNNTIQICAIHLDKYYIKQQHEFAMPQHSGCCKCLNNWQSYITDMKIFGNLDDDENKLKSYKERYEKLKNSLHDIINETKINEDDLKRLKSHAEIMIQSDNGSLLPIKRKRSGSSSISSPVPLTNQLSLNSAISSRSGLHSISPVVIPDYSHLNPQSSVDSNHSLNSYSYNNRTITSNQVNQQIITSNQVAYNNQVNQQIITSNQVAYNNANNFNVNYYGMNFSSQMQGHYYSNR